MKNQWQVPVAALLLALTAGCQSGDLADPTVTSAGGANRAQICTVKVAFCFKSGTEVTFIAGGVMIDAPANNYRLTVYTDNVSFQQVAVGARMVTNGATYTVRKLNGNGSTAFDYSHLIPSNLITDIETAATADLAIRNVATGGAFTLGPAGAKFGGDEWQFGGDEWQFVLKAGALSITGLDDWETNLKSNGPFAVKLNFTSGLVIDSTEEGILLDTVQDALRGLTIPGVLDMGIGSDCARLCLPGLSSLVFDLKAPGSSTAAVRIAVPNWSHVENGVVTFNKIVR